jgi:exopolysaccharide production protein ExoY
MDLIAWGGRAAPVERRAAVGGKGKRLFDVAAGGLLLIAALPAMALVALAIKLTDRGPVLYRHERIGLNGSRFSCLKFRTMVPDAETSFEGLLRRNPEFGNEWRRGHKLRADPRITPLGRLLRRWSLDELPQLFNVVRGEMSLVGPRPVTAAELVRYGASATAYCRARPGLTGLWQVSGRTRLDYEARIGCDLAYLSAWSPWLDAVLLARTPAAIISGDGAV